MRRGPFPRREMELSQRQNPDTPPDPSDLPATLAEERARRARAEAELRAVEERYRLLVEGARDYAILLLDPTGTITTWNEGARRLVGYVTDEIVGRDYAILFTPEDRAAGKPE